MHRLRQRDTSDAERQTGDHTVRDCGHAAVPALSVQHRRYTGQEFQVDLREMLLVSWLQETPETHVGHAAERAVEGNNY